MADLRVLVAPQELKGTLTAVEAAQAIVDGLRSEYPDWTFDVLPMADGGPGTTDALLAALGGEPRTSRAHDPLGRVIDAPWGVLPGRRAVIECAAASGLLRLRTDELDPRRATSYGTGELIAAALDEGIEDVIVGLGGSATNDGGAGMAQALGFRFLDAAGHDLGSGFNAREADVRIGSGGIAGSGLSAGPPLVGGGPLIALDRIDTSTVHPGLARLRCLGATDVTNPLCGPTGASALYGPQKGADARAIEELDAALSHFVDVVKRDLGIDVRDMPGAGAAGGLGAGLIAFLGARLQSGAVVVGEAAGIADRIRDADLVFTGEGRLDGQTAYGKTPQYVARLATEAGKPVVCIAGTLGEGYETSVSLFSTVEALSDGKGPLPDRDEAARQVREASKRAVVSLIDRGVILPRP